MSRRITTLDHNEIKNWILKRNGNPVIIEQEKSEGPVTKLSVSFGDKGSKGKVIEVINWDRFFRIFEEKMLAFQYEEGSENKMDFKFVGRTL